jgi:hypothetical protein
MDGRSNPPHRTDTQDITLAQLLQVTDANPDLPLIFFQGGLALRAGYHVTEVKVGRFDALDCGAVPESWTEIFVQLWDIDEGARSHMPAGKFARIIRKVADHLGLDSGARLTFEVSDGIAPMELHHAVAPLIVGGALRVELLPRAASCKPRDRWLKDQGSAAACCG